MINGSGDQTDNGTVEKYCYSDNTANCDTYGGLYQWDEAMGYSTSGGGVQGLCPEGWHLPTDAEWKILEGTVDTQYPVGDTVWDNTSWRGCDAGTHMKSTSGWEGNGIGDNSSGFTALPGGNRDDLNGSFSNAGYYGSWWSASEFSSYSAWYRTLYYNRADVFRYYSTKSSGFSVRFLRD